MTDFHHTKVKCCFNCDNAQWKTTKIPMEGICPIHKEKNYHTSNIQITEYGYSGYNCEYWKNGERRDEQKMCDINDEMKSLLEQVYDRWSDIGDEECENGCHCRDCDSCEDYDKLIDDIRKVLGRKE